MGKMLLRHWIYWARGTSGKSSFSHTFIKAPMGRFFLDKIFQRVAYENIKLKDGIDMEVNENLDFVNYDGYGPGDPTTLKYESRGTFEKFVCRD